MSFFNAAVLEEIDIEMIEDYKKSKIQSRQTSQNGLRKQLFLLKNILKTYSKNETEILTGKTKIEKDFKKYL